MDLHSGLKEIVDTGGASLLKDLQAVQYLNERHAFSELTAYRGILSLIISEGHMDDLLSTENWQASARRVSKSLEKNFAIPYDISRVVVSSIGFALGHISHISSEKAKDMADDMAVQGEIRDAIKSNLFFNILSSDTVDGSMATKVSQYLDNIIELDLGVLARQKIKVSVNALEGEYSLDIYVNIEGKVRVRDGNAFSMDVTLYDNDGKVIANNTEYAYAGRTHTTKRISFMKKEYVHVAKITRILVFLDT